MAPDMEVFNGDSIRTGQPASYRHPRTGEPYATIEAYKTLQRSYEEAQAAKAAAAKAAAEQRALLTQRQGELDVCADAELFNHMTTHILAAACFLRLCTRAARSPSLRPGQDCATSTSASGFNPIR